MEILVSNKKAHIFLVTHGIFHNWKVLFSEDNNENMPDYGNHNNAYTVRYR